MSDLVDSHSTERRGKRVPSHHLVMFLCNNDHGLPTGGVECVEIADEIRLTCQSVRPKTFRLFKSVLKVGRYHYEHLGSQSCVGNLFWDAATMHVAEARRLVRNLLADGWAVEEHAEDGPFAHLVKRAMKKAEPSGGTER